MRPRILGRRDQIKIDMKLFTFLYYKKFISVEMEIDEIDWWTLNSSERTAITIMNVYIVLLSQILFSWIR